MDEVDKNIEAYGKIEGDLLPGSYGKWALMTNKELVDTYDSFEDAAEQATKKYKPGTFIIREVGSSSVVLPVSVVTHK